MKERGSTTLWMAGMVLFIFLMGGLAIDLWRGLAAHRQVAATVDAAAIAAASGIDEQRWRDAGVLELDPARVRDRVAATVLAQTGIPIAVDVATAADGGSAQVTGRAEIDVTLLGLIVDGPLQIRASATAVPVLSG